jgi:hypothetical protein
MRCLGAVVGVPFLPSLLHYPFFISSGLLTLLPSLCSVITTKINFFCSLLKAFYFLLLLLLA